MKNLSTLVFIALSLLSTQTFAGTTTGTVHQVFIHQPNDNIMFNMNSSNPALASCATTNRYAFRVNTDQGKAMLSAVLTARTANQELTVVGTGLCDIHGDAETIQYLYLE